MNVLYTILSVLGIFIGSVLGFIFLVILILLPMRVRAVVKYNRIDGFRLSAGLGPILLKLFPRTTRQKKRAKKKLPKANEKAAEDFAEKKEVTLTDNKSSDNKEKSEKKQNGFVSRIKALKVADYLVILEKASTHFLSKIYFYRLHLDLTVASSDASKTAQLYGKLDGLIFPLLGFLDSKKKIKDGEVHIRPDFTSEKFEAALDTEICFRLFRAIHAGIIILIYIYKNGRRIK